MANHSKIPEIGPLEYRLLRLLWRRSPLTAREVMDEFNRKTRRNLKYTTIMTLLTRLSEKGILEADRDRQPFRFSPAVSREQIVGQRVAEFVDLFFDGRPADLALRLVEDTDLSEDTIRRLEEMLQRHRQEKDPGQEVS